MSQCVYLRGAYASVYGAVSLTPVQMIGVRTSPTDPNPCTASQGGPGGAVVPSSPNTAMPGTAPPLNTGMPPINQPTQDNNHPPVPGSDTDHNSNSVTSPTGIPTSVPTGIPTGIPTRSTSTRTPKPKVTRTNMTIILDSPTRIVMGVSAILCLCIIAYYNEKLRKSCICSSTDSWRRSFDPRAMSMQEHHTQQNLLSSDEHGTQQKQNISEHKEQQLWDNSQHYNAPPVGTLEPKVVKKVFTGFERPSEPQLQKPTAPFMQKGKAQPTASEDSSSEVQKAAVTTLTRQEDPATALARARQELSAAMISHQFEQCITLKKRIDNLESEIARRNDEKEDESLCVICMDNPKNSTFVPCGHVCCCEGCGKQIMGQASPRCPICRGVPTSQVKLYT